MRIELTHPFIRGCRDYQALLKNCFKFSTFANRVEKQALAKATGGNGEIDTDIQNKYKGDAFELFVEAFVKVFGADILIGIDPQFYEVTDCEDDYGVDAIGKGLNGKVHTLQMKYRQAHWVLTTNGDHLSNFRSLSTMSVKSGGFGVDPDDKCQLRRRRIKNTCNMTIIHCGKEIHWEVKEKMLRDVREINRKDIRQLVDDNGIFWDCFRESWKAYKKSLKKKV